MALEPPTTPRTAVLAGIGERHGVVLGVLAAGAGVAAVIGAAAPYPHQRIPLVAFGVVACGLVVVLRRWPVPVLAVAVAATAFEIVNATVSLPCGVMVGLTTAVVASRLPRRRSMLVAAATVVVLGATLAGAAFSLRGSLASVDAVESLVPVVAGWFVGDSVAARRRYLAREAAAAEVQRRAQDDRARLEVREERVRIARELHDVVAHTLAVITVQAGVGRRLMDRRPEQAVEALRSIEEIGRSAQDELRVVLGLLRDGDGHGPSLAPAPRLVDLKELVETVQASGVPVELELGDADAAGWSPAVELTVYRVVQEALTNVVKHAPGARVRVAVTADDHGITVEIHDDGGRAGEPAGTLGPGGGNGIVGMRERVGAWGGSLRTGRLDGGGFSVVARIPVDGP